MNHKKIKHVCKTISGTQCGIWTVKIWRFYFFCSDRSGWHFKWLNRKPDKQMYGGFLGIGTAFGKENCTFGE